MNDRQRIIEKMGDDKDMDDVFKVVKLKYETTIAAFIDMKEKILQIKTQLLEKIKIEIDSSLAQIVKKHQIIQQPLIPPRFVIRRTDDLVPSQKQTQNQQFPLQADLSYDKHIVGVKNLPGYWSWQFILNNNTMSTFDCSKLKAYENNYVTSLIQPEGSAVHKIQVQFNYYALLGGLRLLDK